MINKETKERINHLRAKAALNNVQEALDMLARKPKSNATEIALLMNAKDELMRIE